MLFFFKDQFGEDHKNTLVKLPFQRLKHTCFHSCESWVSTNEKSRSWGAAGRVSPLGEEGPKVLCNEYGRQSLYLVPGVPLPLPTVPTLGGSRPTPWTEGQASHFKAPPLAKHQLVPSENKVWHHRYSCRWDKSNFPYSSCPAVKKFYSSLM